LIVTSSARPPLEQGAADLSHLIPGAKSAVKIEFGGFKLTI
jgi:hypothetical protein